ncbi:Adaptor for signal transduction [Ceratobasidium sp. UAMH 11750]|nr:Adaptor for signal transduction [Ceratobasidium sp. UAMH 11750]
MQLGAIGHSDSVASVTVSSAMSASDIIALLVQHECPDITHELDLSQSGRVPISGGGFGDIYKGTLNGGGIVAIKCPRLYLQRDDAKGHKFLKHAARELYVWSRLKHENILPLLGLAQYRDQMAMLSPWMDNGTLLDYIERNPTVDRCQLFIEVSEGLAYLHKNGAVHGDIKSGNVLVSREGVAKLADFGCTQLKQNTLRFTTTTPNTAISLRWAAPEVIAGDVMRSKEADVYAFGMTLLEAITGTVPFSDKTDIAVLFVADLLWGIMLNSWAHEPSNRPDSATISGSLKCVRWCATMLPIDMPANGPLVMTGSNQDLNAPQQSMDNTTSAEAHSHLPPVDQVLSGINAGTPRIIEGPPRNDGYGGSQDLRSRVGHVVLKFGDQTGQDHNNTEPESHTSAEETESTNESNGSASKRNQYVPPQSDRDYPNRDRDDQSKVTSAPAMTVNAPMLTASLNKQKVQPSIGELLVVSSMTTHERPQGLTRNASSQSITANGAKEKKPGSRDGNDANPYMSFKVALDDPCWKVVPAALKRYRINDDWQHYAMFICYENTDRCLSYDEKPLLLFQKLKDANKNPVFTLRHIKDVLSPIAIAQQKQASRLAARRTNGAATPARRPRLGGQPAPPSISAWSRVGNESSAATPAEGREGVVHATTKSYAIAIYPYMAELDDEFDVSVHDAFITIGRAKAWWIVQRDSPGTGILDENATHSWVPSGCLLETSVPPATAVSEAVGRPVTDYGATDYRPIMHMHLTSTSFSGIALRTYHVKGDEELELMKGEYVRVFKRYSHWSYAVKESNGERGGGPSWFIGKVSGASPATPNASGMMNPPAATSANPAAFDTIPENNHERLHVNGHHASPLASPAFATTAADRA